LLTIFSRLPDARTAYSGRAIYCISTDDRDDARDIVDVQNSKQYPDIGFVGGKGGEAVVATAPYEACAVPGGPALAVAFLTALRPTIAR
jgi:hypothetical protein